MDNESIEKRVLHLREVEKLSARQIAKALGMGSRRIKRILEGVGAKPIPRVSIVEPYRNLIAIWYREYPRLKAKQIYERLKPYGYQGSYPSVASFSREYRLLKSPAYHTLSFLPGEEAQIDWFFFRHETLGMVAGFLYVLAYSRYAWGRFYPRTTFEFFLAGHLECFEHLKGLAHRHRYDNLKSVILLREHPHLEYNPQFLDFSRFFGFSIHVCNPYKGNEKGRVERVIRDVRVFLYGQIFADLKDLNHQFWDWLIKRNQHIHRATGKTPLALLGQEKLLSLPQGAYSPTRIQPTLISKTALVEFETNRYSVPSGCASRKAEIIVWPERIEIFVGSQKVAAHRRLFQRNQMVQNPLHTERLLQRSPHFKYERIVQLIDHMDPVFRHFLTGQENESERCRAAYELFTLLKTHSRVILVSALRELVEMKTFKIKALRSLLNLPNPKEGDFLWPANAQLLNLRYDPRKLADYDPID